jgi:hypothetical protein
MDIKSAFLNSSLEEEIYGLKQALHAWNLQFHGVLTGLGFMCMHSNARVYVYHHLDDGGITIFIILYVNDITMLGNLGSGINQIKLFLSSHYNMTDLGEIESYLGVHITCNRSIKCLEIDQSRYISKILNLEWQMPTQCTPHFLQVQMCTWSSMRGRLLSQRLRIIRDSLGASSMFRLAHVLIFPLLFHA